ncbi:hypothetical protein [Dongia rigui]|uniref:Uncharacterized protein n=1 Tax=Dongia rigui TaxID=940149 RepID=A0ABU5DTC7_9PROT|nr:hypothetical protein [Dongia rigui]MDY0870585.1 hypothetical protein [Dongia rigui]
MSTNQKTIPTGHLFISPELLTAIEQRPALDSRIKACLERHRAGDDGLITETIRSQNRAACDTRGAVISAYQLDPTTSRGEAGNNLLWIKTLAGWGETFIMLPSDLDREAELILYQEIED